MCQLGAAQVDQEKAPHARADDRCQINLVLECVIAVLLSANQSQKTVLTPQLSTSNASTAAGARPQNLQHGVPDTHLKYFVACVQRLRKQPRH